MIESLISQGCWNRGDRGRRRPNISQRIIGRTFDSGYRRKYALLLFFQIYLTEKKNDVTAAIFWAATVVSNQFFR